MNENTPVTWHTPENAVWYEAFAAEHELYRETSRELVSHAKLAADLTVVDLACGTGVTTRAIVDHLGDSGRVIALDYSAAQLSRARAAMFSPRVSFVEGAVEELGRVVEGGVDRVLCNSAFWQLDLTSTLRTVSQVGAPDVRLVFNMSPGMFPDLAEQHFDEADFGSPPDAERPSLVALTREIAERLFGYRTDLSAREERAKGFAQRFRRGFEESDLEIVLTRGHAVTMTPESTYAWFSIPIFRRNILPDLDAERSKQALDEAYRRWRPYAQPSLSSWLIFAAERRRS